MSLLDVRSLPPWRLFAGSAVLTSMLFGFAVGTWLFVAPLLGVSPERQLELVRLHGHVQLYGFAIALTIGVAYWFLPRLWGMPHTTMMHPLRSWVLLFGGMAIRTLGVFLGQYELVLLGAITESVGGASVAIDFARLVAQRPASGKERDPAVLLAIGLTAVALPLGLGADTLGIAGASSVGTQLGVLLGFYGVVVPVALAMSGRLFPLYFRTRIPNRGGLAGTILLNLVGLVLRCFGVVIGHGESVRLGGAVQGLGILGAIVALRLLEPRRALTGVTRVLWHDPTAWMATIAYGWFAVAAIWLIGTAVAESGRAVTLEWHLIGVGYLLTLIFAVGSHLLPGFAGQRSRAPRAGWLLLVVALGMTSLRLLAALTSGGLSSVAGSLAGLFGMGAMAVFAWHVGLLASRGRRPHGREPTC